MEPEVKDREQSAVSQKAGGTWVGVEHRESVEAKGSSWGLLTSGGGWNPRGDFKGRNLEEASQGEETHKNARRGGGFGQDRQQIGWRGK